ncbi:SixA phosphatase family protein [Polycladidibacter hongkongensis]|uniref:SixA phosphatase family protein n=1 Tax=Polycladidibacter hongkongensis TaxID=1647556 RepID=UPI000836298E|nr:histidine phosphatase family protein [Pseudovibrio hongkongensis]
MLRLLLMRHAKSDWGDPRLPDCERPLNTRGEAAAQDMAAFMAAHHMLPELVLCSTSLRTRMTLSPLLPYLSNECRLITLEDLYQGGGPDYVETICAYGGLSQNLLVLGHMPNIQQTASELCGGGNPALIDDMEEKYPTAALSVIAFDKNRWSEISRKEGRMVSFIKPRELPDSPPLTASTKVTPLK